MMTKPKRQHRKAFTLIELLVVIVIIAILAAIAIPVIGNMKIKSLRAESINNIRQLFTAVNNYAADNAGNIVESWVKPIKWADRGGDNWRGVLARKGYLGEPDLQTRPDSPNSPHNFSVLGSPIQNHLGNHVQEPNNQWATYAMNGVLTANTYAQDEPVRVVRVENMSKTMLLCEGSTFGKDKQFNPSMWLGQKPEYTGEVIVTLFLDGHVETIKTEEWPKDADKNDPEDPHYYFWTGGVDG